MRSHMAMSSVPRNAGSNSPPRSSASRRQTLTQSCTVHGRETSRSTVTSPAEARDLLYGVVLEGHGDLRLRRVEAELLRVDVGAHLADDVEPPEVAREVLGREASAGPSGSPESTH